MKSKLLISVFICCSIISAILGSCIGRNGLTGNPPSLSQQIQKPTETAKKETPTQTGEITQSAQISELITSQNVDRLQKVDQISQPNATDMIWVQIPDQEGMKLFVSTDSSITTIQQSFAEQQSRVVGVNEEIQTQSPKFLTTSSSTGLVSWTDASQKTYIWDASKEEVLNTIDPEKESITGLAFSNSGLTFAMASLENNIDIYDLPTFELVKQWSLDSWITDLSFSPNDDLLSGVVLQDFEVVFIDLSNGAVESTMTWTNHASPALYHAYLAPDWTKLVWIARGSAQIMSVPDGTLGPLLSHEDFISAADWSADGKLIATSAGGTYQGKFSPLIYVWDVELGQIIKQWLLESPATKIDFSPDGYELAILDGSGTIQIWTIK